MSRRVPVPPELLSSGAHPLPPDAAHYVRDVLRLKAGAEITVFDGQGRRASAVLREGGVVEVGVVTAAPPLPPPRVDLVCALSKGEKLDFIVEKASEMGARSVWPVISTRSVVQLSGEKAVARVERWERVAEAAARQCGRDVALVIQPVRELRDALPLITAQHKRVLTLAQQPLTRTLPVDAESVALLTGPEGGLDGAEVAAAAAAGFVPAGLGELTLRAETAPLVALAAVLAHAGRI
ncbi:MAG: RsmE family RNA methyltransferase [Myxococcota bacterium]